jgi:hypothetical protein
MFIAVIPLLVAIIGLLMYILATNTKVAEIGRLMFACGLLALMFASARESIRIGARDQVALLRLV